MLYYIKPRKMNKESITIKYGVTIISYDSTCTKKCHIRATLISKNKLLAIDTTIFNFCTKDYV